MVQLPNSRSGSAGSGRFRPILADLGLARLPMLANCGQYLTNSDHRVSMLAKVLQI